MSTETQFQMLRIVSCQHGSFRPGITYGLDKDLQGDGARLAAWIEAKAARVIGGHEVPPSDMAPAEKKPNVETRPKADLTEKATQDWTLQMAPEEYLKRHPEGPHAALARTLVDEKE